ncbi:hypothetical protein WR25_17480 [Diploscapter pachys]|uniref:Lipocalin domain-containing protein n=1 Tax=Diploscapter pachys TaxID=2018661 RepID=A0A2A2L654_9BILA|nr:hypothetical protein WR25_17480 [Diploscapter pachys]
MIYYMKFLSLFTLFSTILAGNKKALYLSGIPVPGLKVPVLRIFENYAANCQKKNVRDFGFDQIAQFMSMLNGEEVAKKIYNGLFHQMADIQIDQLMGKWYVAVDTAKFHPDSCPIFYFSLISKAEFSATFTSTLYANRSGEVVSYEGIGTMTGREAAGVFFNTGHPNDQCPYVPVKLGGWSIIKRRYEYMVLSTPIKYPTMVLTRDLSSFSGRYKKEVYEFLENFGFLSPIASLNTRLDFLNTTLCQQTNSLYDQMTFAFV